MAERIEHPFEPICDPGSKILILGTLPSPKSREVRFYYGHPQNRFWHILSDIFSVPLRTNEEKTALLHSRHIALWDVLQSCEIRGADDASIRNAVPNDLSRIIDACPIGAVFTNGQKAGACYRKYFGTVYQLPLIVLPSTSPANCRNWTYETLKEAYKQILDYL